MRVRPDRESSQAIEDLRSYGRSLIESVPPGQAESLVGPALVSSGRRPRSRILVVALAAVGLLAVSNVALASLSDRAAPGDFLYAFDRGYEWASDLLGATNRTPERLAESEILHQRGDTGAAIELLIDELAAESSDKDLLATAIEELQNDITRANQGQGNQVGPGPAAPSQTAPGRDQQPGGPSDTAPGQIQDDATRSSPSITAPGHIKDDIAKTSRAYKNAVTGYRGSRDVGQGNTRS